MVKMGFIVEGDSEKLIVESENFRDFLLSHNVELITPVVNAKGGGNLLPQNIDAFLDVLMQKQAETIVVLTDLENEDDIETVQARIANERVSVIFVAVKALEAWFLADTEAMCSWLELSDFVEPYPEATVAMPWDRLKAIAANLGKRGPGTKVGFAKKMIKQGFNITRAAQHAECPSARALVEWFENQNNAI